MRMDRKPRRKPRSHIEVATLYTVETDGAVFTFDDPERAKAFFAALNRKPDKRKPRTRTKAKR